VNKRLAYGTGRNEELKLCYFCSEIHPWHVEELRLWRINRSTIKPETSELSNRKYKVLKKGHILQILKKSSIKLRIKKAQKKPLHRFKQKKHWKRKPDQNESEIQTN